MALTFQCLPVSKIDGYIMDSVLVCPEGYKSVVAEQTLDFLEFDREAFDLGVVAILSSFAVGFGIGVIVSLIRKLR